MDEFAFLRLRRALRARGLPWRPFVANVSAQPLLPECAAYLAASALGDVLVDKVKCGPDKGSWRVDEVRSPVIFERSRTNERFGPPRRNRTAVLVARPQTELLTTVELSELGLDLQDCASNPVRGSGEHEVLGG
jgi:hypothetical protein